MAAKETLWDRHKNHQNEYTKRYGNNTLVFYAVGKFYEYYEHYDMDRLERVSQLLGYRTMAGKDAEPPGVGIPLAMYEIKRQGLVEKGYTLIRFDELKEGNKINRVLTSVDTVGSVELQPSDSNNIIMIYIEVAKKAVRIEDSVQFIGVAGLNVSNSETFAVEFHSCLSNPIQPIQELYRLLLTYPHREMSIVVHGIKADDENYKKWIYRTLELSDDSKRINYSPQIDSNYLKTEYQDLVLRQIFPKTKPSDLDLDRHTYATIAYVMLLQFCHEYNDRLVRSIKPPKILTSQGLKLIDNAIAQLNILPVAKELSLYDVVNNCNTKMGERYLREMLAAPMTDPDQINRYYRYIDQLIQYPELTELTKRLSHILDLDLYQRKVILGTIQPHHLASLINNYRSIYEIDQLLRDFSVGGWCKLGDDTGRLRKLIDYYMESLNFESLRQAEYQGDCIRVENSIFKPGVIAELDEIQEHIDDYRTRLQTACDLLSKISGTARSRDITYNIDLDTRDTTKKTKGKRSKDEDSWFYIEVTEARGRKIKENMNSTVSNYIGDISIVKSNSKCHITSDLLLQWANELLNCTLQLNDICSNHYKRLLTQLSELDPQCNSLIRYITLVDYLTSAATTAKHCNYHRPTIVDSVDAAYVDIQGLRHPIIERILDREYITNDIELKNNGILLYGANSGGKSSLAKAVACNIVLAQCGLYTACNMRYKPYTQIITRLSGNDNIHKGHSSYIVEMIELKTILKWSDENSLVIGDELCRGTENYSAGGLIVATIRELVERKTAFIFSTHLHYLTDIPHISQIPEERLRIRHLSTHYDAGMDTIVFDRKLKPGNGDTVYGIEVARGLHFDEKFIGFANRVRQELLGSTKIVATKRSNYNKNLYMDKCFVCGDNKNLETHHRHEQHRAENGYVDHIPLHGMQNLAVLCDKCHDRIHNDGLKMVELQTLMGRFFELQPE